VRQVASVRRLPAFWHLAQQPFGFQVATLKNLPNSPDNSTPTPFPAELSDEEQVRQLMMTVGALDLLVYAAGAVVRVNLREMSLAEWERVMAANLTGAFFVLKHAQWNSPAQAIFLGVYLDFVRVNGLSVYAASKAALEMMLAVARREMRQSGVRLTLVRLPEVATNLWSVFGGPPKRAFSPDEVAQRIIEGALVEPPPEVLEIARRQ
jgi:cyclic-di-GMP-binding biofilm dispersal mediator protein